jgi:hypothetical protein
VAYSPVYSVPLVIYTPETPNESFLVPDGFTAVIREIDYYCAVGGGKVIVAIGGTAGAWFCNFASLFIAGVADSAQWTGRVTAPENYTIDLDVAAVGVDDCVYVGGYLLRNVAT